MFVRVFKYNLVSRGIVFFKKSIDGVLWIRTRAAGW